jgi:Zinc finger, C4 type (two domains)
MNFYNTDCRKTCQACRLKKCAEAGMKSSWVMTEEEKMDKKMRAVAKKSSDGAPVPKPKATPKADTGGPPQAGTLQVTLLGGIYVGNFL